MRNVTLSEETLGYVTSQDPSNTDKRYLIAGSKNTVIDSQKKVKIRSGYTRLGSANTALTEVRNGWTWYTSTGTQLAQRFYDDELEVYLGTIDGTVIDAWTRVSASWSTTEKMRSVTWFDTGENIDLQLMVVGDDNIYEWNGAVAVVSSVGVNSVTKTGTSTWAQNRFYTTRNKTFTCVRTGTDYTYTGGETTTTVTGIASTAGLVAGDILVQKIITSADKPAANRINHIPYVFENQLCLGSEDDQEVYISKNSDYDDFSYSSPRITGEGALLTLDGTTKGISSVGSKLVVFAGRSSIFTAEYAQITVGTTLAETLKVKKLDTGIDQGALNHESIVQLSNSLAYLSNEVALRLIENPDNINGINPKTLSNPIKPDFDAEDWTGAFGYWYKNILFFTAPATGRVYMLNFIEDADGKVFRFWNPPQVLPVGALAVINTGNGDLLHGHSNATPETYLLFDGQSDGQYENMDTIDKLPIDAVAKFAYNNYGKRSDLKTFDEYYVEGEINPNTTDLVTSIDYNYDGSLQTIEKTISGSDSDILEGLVGYNSLAQQSLAVNPLGSLLNPPSNARKFRVIFEIAREDFFEISTTFSTNEVDRYWAIIAHGANATISRRKASHIYK